MATQIQKISFLAIVTFLFAFASELEAGSRIYTGFFSSKAVGGYDTVAYFEVKKPVKGLSEWNTEYQGAEWYFSSRENLEKFKRNPEKYAPQYGGYCAWAVANGDTAKGDPLHWTIHAGKLYLNYNESIQNQWLEKMDEFIAKADNNWPGVIE